MGFITKQQGVAYTGSGNESSHGLAYTNNVVSGNLLVCATELFPASAGGVAVTVADDQGNSWTQFPSFAQHNGRTNIDLWYCRANAGGVKPTVTVTPAAAGIINMYLYEGDNPNSSPADQVSNSTGNGTTSYTSGNVTTTTDGELYFGVMSNNTANGTFTGEGGWAVLENVQSAIPWFVETLGDGSSQAQGTFAATATSGSNNNYVMAVATFKPAVGATAKLFEQPTMTGLGAGGPFFANPIGCMRLPKWMRRRTLVFPSPAFARRRLRREEVGV